MSENNEQAVIEAIRSNRGGLGGSLAPAIKRRIISGHEEKTANTRPIDEQAVLEAAAIAINENPVP